MADSWWDSRTRPCLDSVSVTSMNLFQETTESTTTTTTSGGGGGGDRGGDGVLSNNPSLQMMELGLSSQPISQPLDWNQALYRGDQGNGDQQSGYQTLIQEDNSLSSNTSIFQETQWKPHKMYSEPPSEFKQINVRGFRLDEPVHYNDEHGLNPSFQTMDHSYGGNSTIIQSLFGTDNNTNQQDSGYDQNQGMSYSYQSSYGGITMSGGSGSSGGEYPPPPHAPQEFLGNSPPKVQPPSIATQPQFSNNARFWNASAVPMNDVRSTFFPLQVQPPSTMEDKPKNPISEMVKKSNTKSSSTKRPRNENPPLPAFKVRKEKMGDRITALQQLVSPFGKTDTASVLSEAIEYIKFLHEQVNVLSTPYLKNAAIMQQQQQQITDKPPEGSGQDLRSRGLCLVPISSTFPVTHETTVDFWTPSFGGTFR